MVCCQCQGIEELFNDQMVQHELSRYRSKGASKTTRMLTEALEKEDVRGLSLLDIGGGVGAIQHRLLQVGCQEATDVDASTAYLRAAREEAARRGLSDRVSYQHGNFVDLADRLPDADIVTLDRVICCYPEMEELVRLSAMRALKLYGVVYPRDTWWIRAGIALANFFFRLRRSTYRGFVHPTKAIDLLINRSGFKRCFYRRTLLWQVVVYSRE